MAERPPPLPGGATPAGARARFGGILEGRRTPAEAETLRAIAAEIDALLPAGADLELEGGRFSLLLSDEEFDAGALGEEEQERFVALLRRLVAASSDPRSVESTLRCSVVSEDEVVETLFAVAGGELRTVSRARAPQAGDRREGPPRTTGRRRAAIALVAAVLALAAAWQGRWFERAFAPGAAELELDAGDFEGLLAAELAGAVGAYELRVGRGPRYPETTAALDEASAAAETTRERAAVRAVGDGATIHAQLLDGEGRVLLSAPVELRALLTSAEARARARLEGRRRAARVLLALDDGRAAP